MRFDEVQARTREFAQSVEELGATVLRNQLRRAQVLAFFIDCRPVWLAWRRARRRTPERGSCARLATRCD